MHVERLTKLAELLESHNGYRVIKVRGREMVFDLGQWKATDAQLKEQAEDWLADTAGIKRLEKLMAKNNCGTTCCAVGLAAQSPWFNRQGLKLTACDETSA